MTSVTLEEAQAKLPELIEKQAPGEELRITINGETVAKLVTVPRQPAQPRKVPQLGTQRGSVLSMEHFDGPLEDFKEYME